MIMWRIFPPALYSWHENAQKVLVLQNHLKADWQCRRKAFGFLSCAPTSSSAPSRDCLRDWRSSFMSAIKRSWLRIRYSRQLSNSSCKVRFCLVELLVIIGFSQYYTCLPLLLTTDSITRLSAFKFTMVYAPVIPAGRMIKKLLIRDCWKL